MTEDPRGQGQLKVTGDHHGHGVRLPIREPKREVWTRPRTQPLEVRNGRSAKQLYAFDRYTRPARLLYSLTVALSGPVFALVDPPIVPSNDGEASMWRVFGKPEGRQDHLGTPIENATRIKRHPCDPSLGFIIGHNVEQAFHSPRFYPSMFWGLWPLSDIYTSSACDIK